MTSNSLLRTDKEFSEIYERNFKRVYQICFMHLKNKSDSEDAVQTVFLRYLKSSKEFSDLEHEKAWFILTAQNHCRDLLKCWWRTHSVDFDSISEISYNDKDKVSELTEKLLKLPTKYKEVLYLYYFEGYKVKEISNLLKRNESTIRTQLSKGREYLKINLGGYYE